MSVDDDKSTLALKIKGSEVESPKQRIPVAPGNSPWSLTKT